jgi:hypothetical protein
MILLWVPVVLVALVASLVAVQSPSNRQRGPWKRQETHVPPAALRVADETYYSGRVGAGKGIGVGAEGKGPLAGRLPVSKRQRTRR